MLTKQHRQEALSRAYVQAIAAHCGVSCTPRLTDYGIDLSLHDVVVEGKRRSESGFVIDVQGKRTSVASVDGTNVKYDLDVRAYDNLRNPTAACPRILVLLVLPEDESQWVTQTAEELTLRHCAYWESLRGRAPVPNLSTVRITITQANVFSVPGLRALFDRFKKGEPL